MREGNTLIGWGMATATYPANRSEASAVARILPDGTAMVASGTQDLGTATYTIITQIAADSLGFPIDYVRFALSDSSLPKAPVSGGSQSAASVSPAVQAASMQARDQLMALALALADRALPRCRTRVRRCDREQRLGRERVESGAVRSGGGDHRAQRRQAHRSGRHRAPRQRKEAVRVSFIRRGVRRSPRRCRPRRDSRAAHRRGVRRRHAA